MPSLTIGWALLIKPPNKKKGRPMKNLIIEPSEYVAKYASPYLADMVEASIEANELPLGMGIDYALEVIRICKGE